jgi:hypothetical protein
MKKLFVVLALVAFVFSVTAAVAVAQAPAPAGDKVNCCVKGECKAGVAKAECAKAGGAEVKDCKDCKK